MSQPPYHLRPNKAIDRLMLIEVLKRLENAVKISDYTYYGFGGPFLEDCRLLGKFYPDISMISIEENNETYNRQKFHVPCRNLKLFCTDSTSFLRTFSSDKKCIFWLDYTKLNYGAFDDFMMLLSKVADWSIIKITLRAELPDRGNNKDAFKLAIENFKEKFGKVVPASLDDSRFRKNSFVIMLQEMIQIAAQKALPNATGRRFQIVSSFYYSDNTTMLSLTGIVSPCQEERRIRKYFKGWKFKNLDWHNPERIHVPILSTKERLKLDRYLPCKNGTGKCLYRALGYKIGEDEKHSVKMMKRYAEFYKYSPYFVKAEM